MLNLPGMQETRKEAASKTEEETALLKACDERVMKPGRKWRPPLRRDQGAAPSAAAVSPYRS